jgi:hypothetical protein
MIRFVADEDFDARIIRGLRRRMPSVDVIPCQKLGLRTVHDRVILENAAQLNRVLLSRDIRTMTSFALERVANGLHMPGVILVSQDYPIRAAIEELEIIAQCGEPVDFIDKVIRLPI